VLQQGVGGQHAVVWLHHCSGYLGGWLDREAQLGLLALVHAQSLQKEGPKTGSSATSHGVEHQESLETSALISQLPDSVQDEIDYLFADSLVSSGEVVGCVLLSGDELLWVLQLSVGTSPHLVLNSGLKIHEHSSWDVLACSSL